MKLNPSDRIISFLREYREECKEKAAAIKPPEYKVVDVTDNNVVFHITSKHIGIPFTYNKYNQNFKGYLRPFWVIEIAGMLDITGRPTEYSTLSPHWLYADTLEEDLCFDDDTWVGFGRGDLAPWDAINEDEENLKFYYEYKNDIEDFLTKNSIFGSGEERKQNIQNIIEKAWTEYWAPGVYKYKAHNYLVQTLKKNIRRVHKCTIKGNSVFVSYEFETLDKPNEPKGCTILSKKELDEFSVSDEKWASFCPKFDHDRSKLALKIIGWQIYSAVPNEEGRLFFREIGSVVSIGTEFYRIDKKMKNQFEGPPEIGIPYDYIYAPASNLYDAIYFSEVVGDNTSVVSNYFTDKLAREFTKKAAGFGLFVDKTKKKKKKTKIPYDPCVVNIDEDDFMEDTEM